MESECLGRGEIVPSVDSHGTIYLPIASLLRDRLCYSQASFAGRQDEVDIRCSTCSVSLTVPDVAEVLKSCWLVRPQEVFGCPSILASSTSYLQSLVTPSSYLQVLAATASNTKGERGPGCGFMGWKWTSSGCDEAGCRWLD